MVSYLGNQGYYNGYYDGYYDGYHNQPWLPRLRNRLLYVLDLYLSQQTSDWHFATLYVNEDVEVYADGKDGFWM